ncbi:MAG: DUF547 domain-containing protein [Candidatus Eisenbacteria bacterium]
MRRHALVVAVVTCSLVSLAPRPVHPAAASSFDHATLDSLLRRHVKGDGVDYRGWKARPRDRVALAAYLARVAAADTSGWPRGEQMALWINAYNALTLARVLDAWPVSSITKIRPTLGVLPGNGVWKEKHRVARAQVSLDDIEHQTLRRHFADPRIHFALNCAARSCPPLAARAWSGSSLDGELDVATRRFVRSGRYNTIVRGRPWALSKIFDWYGEDFVAAAGSVPAFVARYLPAEDVRGVVPAKVRWTSRAYDWSLNEP